MEHESYCYYIAATKATYNRHRQVCVEKGGYLADIRSAMENEALMRFVKGNFCVIHTIVLYCHNTIDLKLSQLICSVVATERPWPSLNE